MPAWARRAVGAAAYLAVVHAFWPLKPGIIVQGAVIGGLTALIAFGISLIYRANRIVSFAQGDLGAVPAVLAVLLIVGPGWPFPLAALVGLAAAVALGAAVELLVIRRFTKAPRLILTVATIGLAQVLAGIGLVLPQLFDLTVPPQSYPSPFRASFTIDPIVFTGNDILAMLVVPIAIIGLGSLLRFTDLGIAIRASAESGDRASLLGVPVSRVRVAVWVIATVLATVAMLLRAGIVGLPIGSVLGPAILLRALAAAVIGRMERLPTIFAAAVALGILESAIVFRSDALLVSPIIFVVLLVALGVQHRDRIARFVEASSWRTAAEVRPVPRELAHLPEVRWGRRIIAALLLTVALALPTVFDDGNVNRAAGVLIFGIVAVSLVVLTGWAGQVSLGQVGFMALGAAVGGAATANWGWDLSLALLAAGAVGAVSSLVIGIPALRVRGLLLAVATLAFSLAVSSWAINRDFQTWLPEGRVPRTPLFGRIVVETETRYYYLCLAVFLGVVAMARALRSGRTGRVLVATRENERATQSFGVNVTRVKLTAFAFSGFFAALAGGLFVHHQQSLGATAYAPEESLRAFTMVVIGGLGSLPGALLGAVYVQSSEWFRNLWPTDLRPLMAFLGTGVGLLVVLMALPGGLGSLLYRARDAALRRIAARRGILVPSLIADQADPTAPAEVLDAPPVAVIRATLPRPDSAASPGLLEVRGLEVCYDGVQVLFGVDLDVAEGEVIALLGTNGAGKSTVLKAISGLVTPSGGAIRMLDDDLTGMAPHLITARGLVQAPGGNGVFPSLTVRENLRIAAWLLRGDRGAAAAATTRAMASFPELAERQDEAAGNLSGGQQQMLTLAMAFIARPRILMIDELSLGLAPAIVGRLLDVVRAIRDQGTAIVLVEQSVNVALTVAHRAYFLEKGEVRFEGPTQDLLDRPDVLRSVFLEGAASRTAAAPVPARPAAPRAAAAPDHPLAIETREVTRSFGGLQAVRDVDLRVAPGEIVGLIGPNGAGKTTLFDLLSGFLTVDRGSIALHGQDITNRSPDARARAGLGRSFQDARLFPGLTVAEAIAVALDQEVEVRDPLAIALAVSAATASEARTRARVDELIALMGLEAFRDKFVAELSTGSRRIVDLACIMGRAPTVILFDEPSSGIAQREAEALGPLLTRVRDETGAALLVIEHDMPLVTGIADRLIAMDQGQPIAEGDPRDVVRHPAVVSSYLGGDPTAVARSGAAETPKELVS